MATEKAPAFQFYPKDFLTDSHVVSMTLTERGAYITLLCLCWMERSLPTQPSALARLCRVSEAAFVRLWPALEPCFTVVNGRLIQGRIERERRKQEVYRQLKSDAGKKGGRPKTNGKHRLGSALPVLKQNESRSKANESPPSSSSIFVSDLQSSNEDQELQPSNQTDPRPLRTALAGDGRFDRFWALYPNKKGKDDAKKAWQKRHPSDALTEIILRAVEVQKQWPEWTKDAGRFIPHPATWLNRGSWDDEPARSNGTAVSDTTRENLAARQALLDRAREDTP